MEIVVWKQEVKRPTVTYYDPLEITEDIIKDANEWLEILHQNECEYFPEEPWDQLVRALGHLRNVSQRVRKSLQRMERRVKKAS